MLLHKMSFISRRRVFFVDKTLMNSYSTSLPSATISPVFFRCIRTNTSYSYPGASPQSLSPSTWINGNHFVAPSFNST